ncbi:MAG: MBL fold metallo-hydrolase [Hyphomonas sp.]
MIEIRSYFDTDTNTVTYLVIDVETQSAALIDTVMNYEPHSGALTSKSIDEVLGEIDVHGLKLEWVLDTHAHADHLSAADYVRAKTGAKIGIGAHIAKVQKTFKTIFNVQDVSDSGAEFDGLFEEGDEIPLGASRIKVIHTPGHTPACVTYLIDDAAFVGDTLFMPDYGTARADFPGGDARTLYQSIQKILSLPPKTRIFVGHDYLPETREKYIWQTTVEAQLSANIHIPDGTTEDAFVTLREARDKKLKAPRLILPSLQVNIRAGAMPPEEDDGHVYLKVPVNRI